MGIPWLQLKASISNDGSGEVLCWWRRSHYTCAAISSCLLELWEHMV
jgi:hypothetical protein